MTENTQTSEPTEDSPQKFLPDYEEKYRERSGDAPAMQAAVCIVMAASVFIINIIFPGIAVSIFEKIKELTADPAELFPNPIDLLRPFFD